MTIPLTLILTVCLIESAFRIAYYWRNQTPSRLKQGTTIENIALALKPTLHPYQGFKFFPHINVIFKGHRIESNSSGYRDREFPKKKKDHVFRIVGIGDSVMMGWGVETPYLHLLNDSPCADMKIETLNFAIAGQSAQQELFVLQEALQYEPDLIILGYVANDWINEEIPRKPATFSTLSYALNFISSIILQEQSPWPSPPLYPIKKATSALDAYAKMATTKVPILVVMDSRYEDHLNNHQQTEMLFKRLRMKTINLLEYWHPQAKGHSGDQAVTIESPHNKKYLIPKDYHPNQLWHQDVAKLIKEKLSKDYCPLN